MKYLYILLRKKRSLHQVASSSAFNASRPIRYGTLKDLREEQFDSRIHLLWNEKPELSRGFLSRRLFFSVIRDIYRLIPSQSV